MNIRRVWTLALVIALICAAMYISRQSSQIGTKMAKISIALGIGGSHQVYKDFPNITFYVRTASARKLLHPFYCVLFRTAVFFWPAAYGKMVLVLDENAADRKFGQRFQKQIKEHYSEWALEVYYERLPGNKVVEFPKMLRYLGYNLQLWNEFFLDKYTNDSIIAYMDTDAQFRVPITKEFLFDKSGTKLWATGISPYLHHTMQTELWASSTEKALGVKVVACFMVTFPQLLYRDTVINTRNHILRRFNTTDFGVALRQFFGPGIWISPINIILHYAWYYEKDRYAWHLNMKDVKEINIGLPEKHRITPEDTIPTVAGTAHVAGRTQDEKRFDQGLFTPAYCETMRAIGKPITACQNITHDLETICEMRVILPRFRSRWADSISAWCKEGELHACCKKALLEHYQNVAHIPKDLHTFNISKVKVVEKLASAEGVKCQPLKLP